VSSYYSTHKVRRSLGHFAIGKVFGASVGLLTLLLLVRVLSTTDYGIYVALVGYLEIFNIVSGCGVVALSERLIPEARSQGDEARIRRLVLLLVGMRVALAIGFGALAALLATLLLPRWGFEAHLVVVLTFQVVAVAESVARFCESIFDSLLMQARAQVSLLIRTGGRLALLVAVWVNEGTLSLAAWIRYEALAFSLGCLFTIVLLATVALRLPRAGGGATGIRQALRPSLQIYVAGVVAVCTGIDMVKILVLRTASAEASAAFGFCASLAWMVQRYLPSYLLVGMVRPIIVAAVAAGAAGRERLDMIVSVLVKLNGVLLGCLLAVCWAVGGDVVLRLSAGKVDDAAALLTLLLLYVFTNSLRAVYGHVALASGCGAAVLTGQSLALLVVAGAVAAAPSWGVLVYPLALILSNILWCVVTLSALQRKRVLSLPDARGVSIIAGLSMLLGIAGVLVAGFARPLDAALLIVISAVIVLTFLFAAMALKPFGSRERNAINNLLPGHWFVI
jgi:O-antigen/teichoic acid export membrane protein